MDDATLQAKIHAASFRNAALLQTLSETDHAVPSLKQQARLIEDLQEQLRASDGRKRKLETRRAAELRDHEKYRDSVTRRFLHKAVGKRERFAEKAAKEEREYYEALQESHREAEIHDTIKAQIDEAERARGEIERDAERHRAAQAELDALYLDIFAGPTRDFPEEDALERRGDAALQAYHEQRGRYEAEQRVHALLGQAMAKMKQSLAHMEEALDHSRMDMFGGGAMFDMMERNALSRSEFAVREAEMLVDRARDMSPNVKPLPRVDINHGNLLGDVLFDNIFTDAAFHDEIKRSRESVRRSAAALNQQGEQAMQRLEVMLVDLKEKERALEQARIELQKKRQEIFHVVAQDPSRQQQQHANSNQPPADPNQQSYSGLNQQPLAATNPYASSGAAAPSPTYQPLPASNPYATPQGAAPEYTPRAGDNSAPAGSWAQDGKS